MRRAVIYYSASGNTDEMAKIISEKLSADLYRIETVKETPDSFGKLLLLGGMQATFGLTPEIKELNFNIENYDEIVLGTPIWANKVASPLNTFLKNNNLSNKTIHVFTTSTSGYNNKFIINMTKELSNIKCNVSLGDKKCKIYDQNESRIENFIKEILGE